MDDINEYVLTLERCLKVSDKRADLWKEAVEFWKEAAQFWRERLREAERKTRK